MISGKEMRSMGSAQACELQKSILSLCVCTHTHTHTHTHTYNTHTHTWGFPSDSAVPNLPAMQETWVQSLGWKDPLEEGMATHSRILTCRIPWTEDPLEKEMATHSCTLAWGNPWTEEPGRLQSMWSQRAGHN